MCVRSELVNQTVEVLNGNSSKTVKATDMDFTFDVHASGDIPYMIF